MTLAFAADAAKPHAQFWRQAISFRMLAISALANAGQENASFGSAFSQSIELCVDPLLRHAHLHLDVNREGKYSMWTSLLFVLLPATLTTGVIALAVAKYQELKRGSATAEPYRRARKAPTFVPPVIAEQVRRLNQTSSIDSPVGPGTAMLPHPDVALMPDDVSLMYSQVDEMLSGVAVPRDWTEEADNPSMKHRPTPPSMGGM